MTFRNNSPHFKPTTRSAGTRLWAMVLLVALGTGAAQATTYYVRTDGGSATQCTGTSNSAYPGSGSNKACAWNSLHQALPASGSARINGGDTVYIAPGNYMLGWGAPGASGGRCYDGGRYDCYLPPIPSGPSASNRTRILGTSASNPARLWGTERVQYMLNLQGSSNVEIGNLEITDQSDCVEFHSDSSARCKRDSAPYGQWAGVGIMASNSRNVYLHDIDIHGMANRGIVAGGLTDWTLKNVKIVANGWAGWDGDIGSGSSNSGNIILRNVEIAWNGCGEKWQSGTPWACWAQTASGYGDGLGTARTGGNWLIEDSYIHHNTSDGLDLLYMDGSSNSSVTVRRTHAVGNAGNQLKTLGKTLIENSVVIGNCAYFNGKDSMKSDDQCRALGNAVSVGLVSGQDITIRHNTITGQGDCLILSEGGSSSSSLNIQNNALVGQVDWRSDLQGNRGELTCGHYAYNSSAKLTYSGNLFYNVKQGQCPSGSICSDPKLVATAVSSFDATPRSGSPLIDKAPYLAAISDDFYGNARPSGAAADIGAIEIQPAGGDPTPAPVCTRNVPTLQVSTNPGGVAAGSTVDYVARVTNNDSAACGATNFALARTVPTGWSSTLQNPGANIEPGQYRDIGFEVTSSSAAQSGTYAIGIGIGSNFSSHTTNAAAQYTVSSAPQPPASCIRSNPQLMISGPGSLLPNVVGAYQIAVKNLDSAACGSSTFDISAELPSGWGQSLSSTRFSLASGSTRTVDLAVTTPATASPGTRQLAVRTTNSGATSHTTRKTFQVVVKSKDDDSNVPRSAHDFDGDGRSDVFWRHYNGGWNVIWHAADNDSLSQVATVVNSDWKIVGEGDFDANGKADLLWRNVATGANTIWLDGKADRELPVTRVRNMQWVVTGVGDFDADGRSDILWRNRASGANVVWRSGDSESQVILASVRNFSWEIQGVGDINGDGRSDVFWRDQSSGRNAVWLSANANTQKAVTAVRNTAWHVEHIADFNGDGVDDLLWRKQGSGNNAIWKSGDESDQIPVTSVNNPAWLVAGVGDFDGDGSDDILWRNLGTGDNTIWRSANSNAQKIILPVRDQAWHVELR